MVTKIQFVIHVHAYRSLTFSSGLTMLPLIMKVPGVVRGEGGTAQSIGFDPVFVCNGAG